MVQRYVVTAWYKDGMAHSETFQTLKSAQAAYKRHVEPKNPHSRINYVLIAKVIGEYRHNPALAMETARKGK